MGATKSHITLLKRHIRENVKLEYILQYINIAYRFLLFSNFSTSRNTTKCQNTHQTVMVWYVTFRIFIRADGITEKMYVCVYNIYIYNIFYIYIYIYITGHI